MAEKTVHVCDRCKRQTELCDLYRLWFKGIEKFRTDGPYGELIYKHLEIEMCEPCCRDLPEALHDLALAQPTVEDK